MAARRIRVETNRLQRKHCRNGNFVAAQLPGINQASHAVRLEERRLLVDEEHKAQSRSRFGVPEETGQFEDRRHTGGIVIRARRPAHTVVMSADNHGVLSAIASLHLGFQIARRMARDRIGLLSHGIPRLLEIAPDIAGACLQGPRLPQIPFADCLGQILHMLRKMRAEFRLLGRKWGKFPGVGSRGHAGHANDPEDQRCEAEE